MFYDFFKDCECVLPEEADDFREFLRQFSSMQACVGFMPAIISDWYPVAALSCNGSMPIEPPNVYVIPVGAHDYQFVPSFEQLVNDFYQEDVFPEEYGISLEEMILLRSPAFDRFFKFSESTGYNAALCRISMPGEEEKCLVIVPETPEDCWKKLMEPYGVACEILIDSNKGLGDWFDTVPLYTVLRETNNARLLPRFYFKGMCISCDVPRGFRLIYTIPTEIIRNGHVVADRQKEIYAIDWDENKKYDE